MKVTIVGLENTSYTDKTTGELKEQLTVSYTKPFKGDSGIGSSVGSEVLTARSFPEQYAQLNKLGEKALGKSVVISKDVRKFRDAVYSVLDEFEVLA